LENQSAIIELFVKYIQYSCTPDEVKQLFKHFEIEEDEETLRRLITAELNFEGNGAVTDSKEDAVLLEIKTALMAEIGRDNDQQPRLIQPLIPRWFKIAAFWLLVSGMALLLFDTYLYNPKIGVSPVNFSVINTARAERKKVVLFDGTTIWLSPSSTLEYPDQLIGNSREVKLEGEAFFNVAKDKKHPFIIHSDHMDTRVVGTSFNVQSFKGQADSRVTVVTGIVKVSGFSAAKQETVVLRPDQQSRFNRQNGSIVSAACPNAKQMLKRREGILDYDSASVQQIAADFKVLWLGNSC
jgi:transmembrane sensor